MDNATHYCRTFSRFGEVEIVGERGGGKRRVRWPDGSESTVHTSQLTPLERAPAPVGELVRPYTTEAAPVESQPKRKRLSSPAYLRWIRTLRCAWCQARPPSEASHHPAEGHGAMGQKADDVDAIPLCSTCHHGGWHRTGALGHMTPEQTRAWVREQIISYLKRYAEDVLHAWGRSA